MKKIYVAFFALVLTLVKSQVGINTPKPLANLEVHTSNLSTIPDGIIPPRISADSLQLKDHLYGPAQNGALIYITKPVSKFSKKTQEITSSGYYVYDSGYTHQDKSNGTWKKMFSDPNAFAASSFSGLQFSKIMLDSSGSGFQSIQFDDSVENRIGKEYLTDNQYIVPETGLYVINYSIAFENPDQKLQKQRPRIAIMRSSKDDSRNILASKMFDAFFTADDKVSLAQQTSINHIYQLTQGEKLNFGLVTENDDLSSFGNVSTEISVYKIR
ncbi:hypothetical protein [Epilithonimonas arachidiradicis]|uniref:TNF family profile domain-containing protein n=1 Tax=Epilithonimonas arachidiradicis TaxID=1617282 RepID=A0A420D7U9_9FLAO|nr:hypothetical protein [Epilithonimonas arachidiradicis]RKE86778.1 hypothetical protein BXY58_2605 [Epilithonimonas arachidiradicis]GGG62059.1 hypothetical protein GCM10007332_25060 [Epilithonimonas arachidiradicis]